VSLQVCLLADVTDCIVVVVVVVVVNRSVQEILSTQNNEDRVKKTQFLNLCNM